jgi:23S rRNA (uracil1939-C5)-methyltransferase
MIVTTEKITAGGDCLARVDGKIIFIPDSLPKEKLDVEIVEEKRDYARANVVRVLEPSPHRVEPRCSLYGVCGGCNLQIAGYAYQLVLKESIVCDAFVRAGFVLDGAPADSAKRLPPITVVPGSPWEYRSRIQLHTALSKNGGFTQGLMARGKNDVVNVQDCPVAVPPLRAYLGALKHSCVQETAFEPAASAAASTTSCTAVRTKAYNEQKRNNVCVCYTQEHGSVQQVIVNDAKDIAQPMNIFIPLLGERIYFDARGFFQSNVPLFEQLLSSVCASLQIERGAPPVKISAVSNDCNTANNSALDLYSGCGVFAHFLRKKYAQVTAVEENAESLRCAEKNAPQVHTCAMSGTRWSKKAAHFAYDAVVADPPRRGLEKEVCSWLCATHPRELRYISCDPVTLARDAAHLVAADYHLTSLEMYDFYPQTSHIETLATFSYFSA